MELDSRKSTGVLRGGRWSWTLERAQQRSRAGRWSWTLIAGWIVLLLSQVVPQQLLFGHCLCDLSRRAVETAITERSTQLA